CRILLIGSVVAIGYSLAAITSRAGAVVAVLVLIAGYSLHQKRAGNQLSAFGTARWANQDDLQKKGLLSGQPGLILGRLNQDWKPSLPTGVLGLMSPRMGSAQSCRQFLSSLFPKAAATPPLVKLSNVVHT